MHPSTSGDPTAAPDHTNENVYSSTKRIVRTKKGTIDQRYVYKGNVTKKDEYTNTYSAPAPKIKGAVNLLLAVIDVCQGIDNLVTNYNISKDKHALERQVKTWYASRYNHNESIVLKVSKNLQTAIQLGIIGQENMNATDLSQIANIVMFGGNGNESKKIKNIGMRIVREVSKNERKEITTEDIQESMDSELEENMTVKKDNINIPINVVKK